MRRLVRWLTVCFMLLAWSGSAARAQAQESSRPSLQVLRSDTPVRVDGVLDDAVWQGGAAASDFALTAPREGQRPADSTWVRVALDGDRIVFALWCAHARPLRASLAPRDAITDGDHVSVHLDTDGDGQRAYIFGVNPHGVQLDGVLTGEPDFKWDGVWSAETHRGEQMWTAEIAVPLTTIRYSPRAARPWRMWVRRELSAWNEVSSWPPYRTGIAGPIMLQAGDLNGIDAPPPGRDLTIEPYVFAAGSAVRELGGDGSTGAWDARSIDEAGLDLQAGLGSSLALNVTGNPDFSQIEADGLRIGLNRRFPLTFPERRPFFLEGGEVFQTPLSLVYSRRMSNPEWGAKLTGRMGDTRTGVLLVRDAGGSELAGVGAGPWTESRAGTWSLVRAVRPHGDGQDFGVLLGGHDQSGGERNGIAALDARGRFWDHWSYEAQWAHTESRLGAAGDLSGAMGVVRLNHVSRRFEMRTGYRHVDPGYRNELGFQDRLGVNFKRVNLLWHHYPEASALQRWAPTLDALVLHDRTGRLDYMELWPGLDLAFRRNQFVWVGALREHDHWQGRGWDMDRVHLFYENDVWRTVGLRLELDLGDGLVYGDSRETSRLAWQESHSLTARLRPAAWVTSELSVQRYRLADRFDSADDLLSLWLVGLNTNAQFTRRLSVRLYPQYDSIAEHLAVNALVGYTLQPGTVVYLGVDSGWDRAGDRQRMTSRQVFAKASYRFRM